MYTERNTFFRYILLRDGYTPKYTPGYGWYLRPDEIVYMGNRALPGTVTLRALVRDLKFDS